MHKNAQSVRLAKIQLNTDIKNTFQKAPHTGCPTYVITSFFLIEIKIMFIVMSAILFIFYWI